MTQNIETHLAQIQLNSITVVDLTARFLPGMVKAGHDLVINIASTAALQGGSNIAPYAASKHGVLGLVRSVAKEVAKSGITCNAICPGFVDTEMADAAAQSVMDRFDVPREKAISMITSGNPMARLIAPDEVAAAALFLASAGASSVNGHALSVSGGEI